MIDLSQAITGQWNADNSANPGNGVYDPTMWAVVFKYAGVNIPSGVTVTFLNHASRCPVVWLVQGNCTIAGSVVLDGESYTSDGSIPESGPGGFRGAPAGP